MNLLRKIFSPFCLLICTFLLLVIFYKSEIILNGSSRDYYFKYYLFFSILFTLSIISIFLNNNIKDYLIIISITLFISSFVAEYYLINFKPNNPYERKLIDEGLKTKPRLYKEATGKKWDFRNQHQVYKDLLKNNPNVVPYFYPSMLRINANQQIHSLSGVANSLTVFCNENGYYSLTESDRYGFNNPDKEWNSGEVEYVFVGDSYTQGHCVNRPNDIPSVVRKLSNKKTLNLGYGRNGPLIEYATLREYLPKKTKKIIFMYYGGNDLDELNDELNNKVLVNYLNNQNFSQNLIKMQNELDKIKRIQIQLRSDGQKYKLLRLRKLRGFFKDIAKEKKETNQADSIYRFDQLEKILLLTKKLAIENQSQLYFVYLQGERYLNNEAFKNNDLKYFNKVKSIIEKLEINFIDIHTEVFEKEENPLNLLPFGQMGHYTIEGYRKVAESIYNATN